MKRIAAAGICLLAVAGMSAQTALVKSAKDAFKGAGDYAAYRQVVEQLAPAFENPESMNQVDTYFVPGEAGFNLYDAYLVARSVGQDVNPSDMGSTLLDGYDFFLKAFTVDSLPNEKGKIKPARSKKMIDMIAGHVNDFDQAAVGFWQNHDYGKAYDAWEACLEITSNPRYAKTGIKAYPDSVVAQVRYNQALAAWQNNELDKAIRTFDMALAAGNNDPQAYEYAYSVAYQAKDTLSMERFAAEGLRRFGTEDPKFLQWTVNGYIEKKDYVGAKALLDEAIAREPDNAAFYLSYGVLDESMGNRQNARKNFEKVLSLDSENMLANYNMGRLLAEEYDALDQETGSMSQAEYAKYAAETLNPLLRDSARYFEKAYALNPEERLPLQFLKNIYYRLNDAENLKRVEDLLKY